MNTRELDDCKCKMFKIRCKSALRLISIVAVVLAAFFVFYLDSSLQVLPIH
jgi:hypothetical protein